MQAVLYVAHGSRVKAGVEEAVRFLETVKPYINADIQEICFLELAEPTIAKGVELCVSKGATAIAVIPVLLLTANHAKYDIPNEINLMRKRYPSISFTIGNTLGIHKKLIDSLHDRIMEQTARKSEEIDVLLIGRGSSNQDVEKDFSKIANHLHKRFNYGKVDICFLYGRGPSFEEKLKTLGKGEKPVFIVPYLLFTGLLKMGIQKKVEEYGFSKKQVVLCECLGYDENVRQVLIERVEQSLFSLVGSG